MSDTLTFTIQGDSEGYITFECPFCGSEFKLQAGEIQDDEFPITDLCCPYCGLSSDYQSFYSAEVIEKARALAENYMIEQLNKSFKKMSKSVNKSGKGIIKMTYKPLKKVNVKELIGKDTAEVEFACNHCEHHFKALYCVGAAKVYCPFCGVDL